MTDNLLYLQAPTRMSCRILLFALVFFFLPPSSKAQTSNQSSQIKRSEALAKAGSILLYEEWDLPGAKVALDHALDLHSGNAAARADLAWYHVLFERYELAVQEMEKAIADDPTNPLWPAWLGWIHLWRADLDAAEKAVTQSLLLDRDYAEGLHVQSKIHFARGQTAGAIASHERAADLDSTWQYALIHTYALAGKRDQALKLLENLDDTDWNSFGRVKIHLALQQPEQALLWLQKAYDRKHVYFPWFGRDPDIRELRDAPLFQKLYARFELP